MRLCPFGHLMSEAELEALCPECLIELAQARLSPIGRFERVRKLGEGGFGSVYLARDGKSETFVALKIIRNGHFASEPELDGFRREIRFNLAALSQLRDDRIVRILEVGEHDGLPFFTMEYMSGGTLRERMADFHDRPRRAAELMLEIADAVEFLHHDPENPGRPAILHRDLKPGNILFDGAGRLKISDFGLAKRIGDRAGASTTLHAGCPWYIAPEQAFRTNRSRPLTPAADVYSLGAILYELFTGRVPFDGTEPEVLQQLGDERRVPRAPRELVPTLDRYLETVVLNALERNPARRYQSARAFAADLRRALSERAPEELPAVPLRERVRSVLHRHTLPLAALLWTAVFSLSGLVHESRTRARERETITRRLRDDASMASVQAVAFQFQLREYRHRIARLARQPEVVALLHSATIQHPSRVLIERASGFDSLFVLAPDGRMRARTTRRSEEYANRSFEFRDYFRGARALALAECSNEASPGPRELGTGYLGRAHASESDGEFEIAISAPVCDERGWIGVLGATISSNKSFGSVRLEDGPSGHVTALLGPRGADRKDIGRLAPDGYTFVVHPGLAQGQEYQLKYPDPQLIRSALGIPTSARGVRYVQPLTLRDYRDPVAGNHGLWTAALAPVDESGFVVLVQSPREPERSRWASLGDQELSIPLTLFSIGLAALLAAHLRARRSAHGGRLQNAWAERP
ncbi:MAG TPA: protein kinase [Polyangiaceae bacterium]|nr:protein kinase [Polyangiaceae bacterium]